MEVVVIYGIRSTLMAGTKLYFEIRDPRPSNQRSISVHLGMCKLGVGQEFVMRRARYWCVRYQDDSRLKIKTADKRRIWVPQRNEDLGV
jgi:hypothetical protein